MCMHGVRDQDWDGTRDGGYLQESSTNLLPDILPTNSPMDFRLQSGDRDTGLALRLYANCGWFH